MGLCLLLHTHTHTHTHTNTHRVFWSSESPLAYLWSTSGICQKILDNLLIVSEFYQIWLPKWTIGSNFSKIYFYLSLSLCMSVSMQKRVYKVLTIVKGFQVVLLLKNPPANTGDWPFSGGLDSKESDCNAGDPGLIPGSGRHPGEGNGYPLLYSCQENSMDTGVWQATIHGVSE